MLGNPLLAIAGTPVYGYDGNKELAFESGLSVDADGSPHAYHPAPDAGLDYLANAGVPGNWWALVTDNGQPNGNPIIQGPADPAPGYYVSTTALCDGTKPETEPAAYVDAETIPYISLPDEIVHGPRKVGNIKLGDIGYALNKANNQSSYFILADTGDNTHIGEGSVRLAQNLGIAADPKHGGTPNNIVYILYIGSGDGKVKTVDEIATIGNALFPQIDMLAILADFNA